jgi:hypothetical protein
MTGHTVQRAKGEKPPVPMMRKAGGRLSPVSQFDAEEFSAFPDGMLFDLIPRNKRTLPLHKTYWQALTKAVEATGRWGSRETLHTALKVAMGLVEPIYDLRGNVTGMQPHSTAFAAMDQQTFRIYFDGAMAKLSEAVGYDVLAFLEDER